MKISQYFYALYPLKIILKLILIDYTPLEYIMI